MVLLTEMVEFLDRELSIAEIPDYPGALNGLQLENRGSVSRIFAAVDAAMPVIQAAAERRDALLLVHHGMFWQGLQPVRGPWFRKLKAAMDAGLAVYSAHLPLDVHAEWGNNIRLARAVGLADAEPFLEWKGLAVGLKGTWRGTREELAAAVGAAVAGPVHVAPGGSGRIGTLGICTGGAGSEVAVAAAAGVDAFVTGEGPHWSYTLAEELGVDVFYAGHYATETFGVKALAATLAERFALDWEFIDHPTGL